MWLNLKKIFDQLSEDPDVRAVLLSGAGNRAFTSGLDVNVSQVVSATHGTENAQSDAPARSVKLGPINAADTQFRPHLKDPRSIP